VSSQAAPSSGDNSIRLKYVLDYSGVAPAAEAAKKAVEKSAAEAAKSVETSFERTKAAARGTAETTKRSGADMREALQGIEPALATVSNGLQRMGVQGAGGFGALAGAATKLAAFGASPLALAVAGVTALTGVVASWGEESKKTTTEVEEQISALDRLAQAAQRTRDATNRVALGRRAAASGTPTELQALYEDYAVNEERLSLLRQDMEGVKEGARLTELKTRLEELQTTRNLLADQIRDMQAVINVQTRDRGPDRSFDKDREESFRRFMERNTLSRPEEHAGSGALQDTIDQLGLRDSFLGRQAGLTDEFRRRQEETRREIDRLAGNPDDLFPSMAFGAPTVPLGSGREQYNNEAAIERRKAAERELASIRTGTSREVLDLEAQIAAKQEELVEYLREGDSVQQDIVDKRSEEIAALEQTLDVQRQIDEEQEKRRRERDEKKQGPDVQQTTVSVRQAVYDGTVSGLEMAMEDPSNWRGALSSLANDVASALRKSVASSIADGLLGVGKEGSTGGGLFALFSSLFTTAAGGAAGGGGAGAGGDTANLTNGGATAPTGTAAKRSMSGDSRPIVVINSFSERDADAMAQKMTASGAQVVVARANGDGVSRGSIPVRRRG
jgi:hypothetical protein